ncbi:MAG: pilus assembly protein TadG-related protein [Solirubrobacterales bacterium]
MSALAQRAASEAVRMPGGAGSLLATDLGGASGGLAVAAAVGAGLASGERRVLMAEIGAERGRGPTTLASASARGLEQELRELGFRQAAARGRLCWLGLPEADESLDELARALEAAGPAVSIVHVPAGLWLAALDDPALPLRAGLLRADLAEDRPLAALAVIELRERRLPVRVASRPLGLVASRRALAGLEVGGGSARRVSRLARGLLPPATWPAAQQGQALPLTIGAAFVVLFVAAVLAALGGAATGASRAQRAVDLAALSGARSLRDDFPRLFAPVRLANGAPNPRHLGKGEYLARAAAIARQAATRNGVDPADLRVSFPDRSSFAPVRVRTEVTASLDRDALPGPRSASPSRIGGRRIRIETHAEAEAAPPAPTGLPTMASGGGYSGPLAYRQGNPCRIFSSEPLPAISSGTRGGAKTTSSSGVSPLRSKLASLAIISPDLRFGVIVAAPSSGTDSVNDSKSRVSAARTASMPSAS